MGDNTDRKRLDRKIRKLRYGHLMRNQFAKKKKNMEDNTVERVHHTVIEKQLLTALDDKTRVAILLSKEELEDMIVAAQSTAFKLQSNRLKFLAEGMRQLYNEAFE